MKVRKLAVALALAGGLGSGVAQALGLGEIDLQSYLNEPLDAEIDLRKSTGVDANDVFVNIASPQDYERVGLDRNQFLTQLNFNVTTANDGSLVVNVTSKEPLREPYLNFLVEVTWPQGRLMREYAVLVDPPVYAEESNVPEQVSAPASTPQTTRAPQTMRTAPRADAGQSTGTSARARTFGPTGSSDTLWSIAQQVRPSNNLSIQQVMLALQDINPDAFIGGNINRLKRGQVLRVPTAEQARARTRAEANRLVMAQNQAIEDTRRPVDATDAPAPEAAPAGSAAGDELKLVVDDTVSERSAEEGGSAGGAGETAGGVDAGTAVALEELERARRENEELNSRLEDMQEQVATLQRLIELKNTQLSELQQLDEETAESAEQEAAAETGEPGEDGLAEEEAPEMAEGELPADAESGMEPEEPSETAETGTGEAQPESDPEMAESTDEADQTEAAVPPTDSPDAEEQVSPAEPAAPQEQRGFPGTVIDLIVNNPIYQIALGGGVLLLLLALLLLSRKNSNREKAFYEQLNSEAEDGDDSFDLQLDDEGEMPHVEGDDPLAEADAYVAYGRHDQAAQALETAISREPSRSDLRLKLLGIYADLKDRDSFEKQFNEIEALEEDDATDQANRLRERLEDAESVPSIDELESQLRSSHQDDDSAVVDQTLADQVESEQPEETDFDGDFDDLGLDKPRTPDESADEPESWDVADQEEEEPASSESSRDDLIEYDLSGIETPRKEDRDTGDTDEQTSATDDFGIDDSELEESLGLSESDESSEDEFDLELDTDDDTSDLQKEESADEAAAEETGGRYAGFDESASEESDDLDDLELDLSGEDESEDDDFGFDLDESLEEPGSEADQEKQATDVEGGAEETEKSLGEGPEDEDLGDLDESFLDELDAELDKVAAEDDDGDEGKEDSLDDLELDVSEDDVALMEKFAQSEDEDEPTTAIDEELGLEDAFTGEEEATPEEATEADELLDADLDEDTLAEEAEDSLESPTKEGPAEVPADEEEPEPPVASDTADKQTGGSAIDLDESELGDDDDFDFLAGTDEAATKLDLARAYMEMGDVEGARDILEEVALEGNDDQKAEAQDLLKNLS